MPPDIPVGTPLPVGKTEGGTYRVTIIRIMKGITVKLPDATLRRLRQEARTTGRSVAALIRERLEAVPRGGGRSIYEASADLAGSVAGSRKPVTNDRRRFACS